MQIVDHDLGHDLDGRNGTGKTYLSGNEEADDECVNSANGSPAYSLRQ
jgi:hypothetical protein